MKEQKRKEQERKKRFLLLQVNDALFPIGAYSHSYGLETYIQKDLVHSVKQATDYIYKRMIYGFCYNEFLGTKLAYESAKRKNIDELKRLQEIMEAGRVPREVREAGQKLGSRFIKTVQHMEIPYESDVFAKFCVGKKALTHAIVYGVFCAAAGIPYEDTMENYLYAQTSSMVTNCVKTIPLSQTDGQILLYESQKTYQEVFARLENLSWDDLCMSSPGFDIRCMQHEALYSRIYMS